MAGAAISSTTDAPSTARRPRSRRASVEYSSTSSPSPSGQRDWRGNNNIAESIFAQMLQERHPVPSWIVMSAGTGGTSATIGRYLRYRRHATRLCVADVEHSAFFDGFRCRDAARTCDRASLIEGVGRPRVEPSFVPGVVDRMVKVPDAASIAAMKVLSRRLGRRVGGSTGTNFFGLCWLAGEM